MPQMSASAFTAQITRRNDQFSIDALTVGAPTPALETDALRCLRHSRSILLCLQKARNPGHISILFFSDSGAISNIGIGVPCPDGRAAVQCARFLELMEALTRRFGQPDVSRLGMCGSRAKSHNACADWTGGNDGLRLHLGPQGDLADVYALTMGIDGSGFPRCEET